MKNLSVIPPSIRKIISSGRDEISQLEHQYHIWFLLSGFSIFSSILLLITTISLSLVTDNSNLLLIRLMIGVATIINITLSYIVILETINRRRYLLEVQRLMKSGLSFLDSISRGLKGLFGN